MDWNKMCSHDQEIARNLAATLGLLIDDNGVVRKAETKQSSTPDADLQCPSCYSTMDEIRECKKCGHTERR